MISLMGFLVLSSLARLALGQSSSAAPSPSRVETGGGGSVQTHIVTVGKEQNQFAPDSLQASVGDIISFQFFPPNHSVGRAEYQQPCIPYEDTGTNKVGFFSGFYPLDKILDSPPTWNLTVNDTQPIFLYCAAPGSCINYQMVGVINPNSSVSLATQKEDASKSTYMLAPGQPFPSEGGVPNGDVNPAGSKSSNTSNSQTSHDKKLSSGAIAGISVAGVVVALLVAALFFLLGRHKTMLQFMRKNHYRPGQQEESSTETRGPETRGPISYPSSSEAITYAEHPNYQDQHHTAPPYTKHAHPPPAPAEVAELPSPYEKKGQDYLTTGAPYGHYHDNPSASPSISPDPRPLSFWGRSRSNKTQASELAADMSIVRNPSETTNRHRPE